MTKKVWFNLFCIDCNGHQPNRYFFQLCFQGFQEPPKRWLIQACWLLKPSEPLCLCPLPQGLTGSTQMPPSIFPGWASEPSTHSVSWILWNGAHVTRWTGKAPNLRICISASTDASIRGCVDGNVSESTSRMASVNTPGPVTSRVVISSYRAQKWLSICRLVWDKTRTMTSLISGLNRWGA